MTGVHVFVAGLKRPPVFTEDVPSLPPQMIISVPVQTVLNSRLPAGAPALLRGVQASAAQTGTVLKNSMETKGRSDFMSLRGWVFRWIPERPAQ